MAAQRASLQPLTLPHRFAFSERHLRSARSRQQFRTRLYVAAASTQRPHLKEELFSALETSSQTPRTGKLTPDVEAIVDKLKAEAGENPPELRRDWVDGSFHLLLNTTNYLEADASSTLGTLTFQQFHPRDLKVKVSGTDMLSGVDSADHYQTNTYFEKVAEYQKHFSMLLTREAGSEMMAVRSQMGAPSGGERIRTVLGGEGAGLRGVQSALGSYELDSEKAGRQVVHFSAIRIAPADRGKDALRRWLATFKGLNPSMGEDGVATIEFPQRAKGTRDFILLDEEAQVTLGNRGSVVIVRRKQQ